jgi:hypothetical protein
MFFSYLLDKHHNDPSQFQKRGRLDKENKKSDLVQAHTYLEHTSCKHRQPRRLLFLRRIHCIGPGRLHLCPHHMHLLANKLALSLEML